MKSQVVFGIIAVKHILAVLVYVRYLFTHYSSFTKVAQFGICSRQDSEYLIIITVPYSCLVLSQSSRYLPHHKSLSSSQADTRREQATYQEAILKA